MTDKNNTTDGIRVDLMRKANLDDMASTEKVSYIIERIREGRVVILESGLKPNEQSLLVEDTMSKINQEDFTGIEIETYPSETETSKSSGLIGKAIDKTLGNDGPESHMTVIGPADRMETLHKDKDQIRTLLNP